ncbi:MAG TPA: hybrid sensor histidine kinase/response regulator, partial [Pseudomonas sp.]|nr:hybrid sensor histidine kinase/response regulator [Pseudomonas sp.]
MLQDLSNRLLQMPALDDQLQAILDALCTLHGASHGLVMLSDGSSPLRIHASTGFSDDSLTFMDNLEPGSSPCGMAVKDGTRVTLASTETEPRFGDLVAISRSEGFRSVHSTPIRHSDNSVLGTITVHGPAPRLPTAREIRLADLA